MPIPRHVVDAVRDATDLVAVVGKYVRLQQRRNDFLGLCPFHQEKTPSFYVVPGKGIYHCFGCQAGGDVFRFVMQIEGLSFHEAVKELATSAGIEIREEELSPEQQRSLKERATAYDALEAAAKFFESVLWTRPEGGTGRAYLDKRKMSRDTIRAARLGFAPASWTAGIDALQRQGFDPRLLAEVGVAKERDPNRGGGYYDAFRERVMFPIRDERGRVIAFGGRLLEGDGPKYINTPESRLYHKSSVLYGFDMARAAIGRTDRVIVVEGYFDVLAMHQAGFQETVATCGTALTKDHMEKIRRMSRNVVVLLDSDAAGMRAAERALPMFVELGMQPWRLQLPGAKDPDELVREHGPEAMEQALGRREPLLEWVVDYKLANLGGDALGRERAVEELLPVLAHVPGDLLSRVAARLRVDERTLRDRAEAAARAPASPEAPPPVVSTGWRPTREAVHLLWLLVHRYDQVADVVTRADPAFAGEEVRPVVARLLTGEPVGAVLADVADPGVHRALSAIVARDRLYEIDAAALGACDVLEKLGRPRREARLAALRHEVEAATRESAHERMVVALREQKALRELNIGFEKAIRQKDVPRYVALLDEERSRSVAWGEPRDRAAPGEADS